MLMCPICNAQVEDNAKFCPNCGVPFIQPEEQQPVQQQSEQPAQQQFYQQPQQQPAQQRRQQPAPAKQPKKKNSGAVIAIVAVVLIVLAGIGVFAEKLFQSQGYGVDAGSSGNGGSSAVVSQEKEKKPAKSTISGTDVFAGERFSEMLWGYYAADGYTYSGSSADTLEFREDMKYITVTMGQIEREVSALPMTVQFGKYTHFMGSFAYEGEYYYAFTEEGKAMFRKAYMEQEGDLTEEDFLKIEEIMRLDVAQVFVADENGATYNCMFAYEIEGNTLSFYWLDVDDQYNITKSEKPIVEYEFLHDGGKLILVYKGIQRNYLTYGYKATDHSLSFSGYALNESNRYGDLEGFAFYQFGVDDDISLYVELSGGESPVDPVIDLDIQTGNFTISWQERWVKIDGYTQKKEDPTTISGVLIPCTSYGFTDYTGFHMIIDGVQYHYLMSEQEFEERRKKDFEGIEDLTDTQIEDLSAKKRDIIAELEAAFQAAGVTVTIDRDSGRVAMDASVLFATGSHEMSDEGKAYMDKFIDVYTSVVLRDEYSQYVTGIVVEGHTDTSGSYSYNQELSQNRADTVAQHCIARNSEMTNILKAVGCSYDYPIYNEDTSVNMEASRRVTFRFVLTGI